MPLIVDPNSDAEGGHPKRENTPQVSATNAISAMTEKRTKGRRIRSVRWTDFYAWTGFASGIVFWTGPKGGAMSGTVANSAGRKQVK
jgi:hypothetical protein